MDRVKGRGPIVKTCIVPDCGQQFRRHPARAEKAKCCSLRCAGLARRLGLLPPPKSRSPYHRRWTAEDDAVMRGRYFIDGADAVAARLKRTRCAVKERARALGLSRLRPNWTAEDDAWLRDNARLPMDQLKAKLRRGGSAIQARLTYLGSSRRDALDWSATQVAEIFGVEAHCVIRWLESGKLKGHRRPDYGRPDRPIWQVQPEAARDFIRSYPTAFDIRKVDQIAFIDLVLGIRVADPSKESAAPRRQEALAY